MKTFKEFISYFNTPFVRPKLKFYIGKIAVGTPHFFPRKAIKDPDKPRYLKFIPKKIGFDIVSLGWKTKWSQFRFEWAPVISFVFFTCAHTSVAISGFSISRLKNFWGTSACQTAILSRAVIKNRPDGLKPGRMMMSKFSLKIVNTFS